MSGGRSPALVRPPFVPDAAPSGPTPVSISLTRSRIVPLLTLVLHKRCIRDHGETPRHGAALRNESDLLLPCSVAVELPTDRRLDRDAAVRRFRAQAPRLRHTPIAIGGPGASSSRACLVIARADSDAKSSASLRVMLGTAGTSRVFRMGVPTGVIGSACDLPDTP